MSRVTFPIRRSHVARINESYTKGEWDSHVAHTKMLNVPHLRKGGGGHVTHTEMSHVTHINVFCQTYQERVGEMTHDSHSYDIESWALDLEPVTQYHNYTHPHPRTQCHSNDACLTHSWYRVTVTQCYGGWLMHALEFVTQYHTCIHCTEWRRPIGCLKLQVIFCKRATNYRALLRKITHVSHSYDIESWALDLEPVTQYHNYTHPHPRTHPPTHTHIRGGFDKKNKEPVTQY